MIVTASWGECEGSIESRPPSVDRVVTSHSMTIIRQEYEHNISHPPHLSRWANFCDNLTELEGVNLYFQRRLSRTWDVTSTFLTAPLSRWDQYRPQVAGLPPYISPSKCGRGYSCLKVVQQPKVFDAHGQFVPLLERQKEEVVYRGCFVLDIHKVRIVLLFKLFIKRSQDICYLANNGLQYCWCSSKDLCNGSPEKELYGPLVLLILMKYLVTL